MLLCPKDKQMFSSTLSSLVAGWSTVIKSLREGTQKKESERVKERQERERDKYNTETSEREGERKKIYLKQR